MIDAEGLRARFNDSGAKSLDGVDRVLLEGRPSLVETCFAEAKVLKGFLGDFVAACHDEWLDRGSVDPTILGEFLEHRVDTLETLAQKDYWLGLASVDAGGQNVLTIG